MTDAQQIAALLAEAGTDDPREAVRRKARDLVVQFAAAFGEPELPVNMEVLASFLGIGLSDEPPVHSPDAELVPAADGSVHMRVNPDRPETRRRFSMGHEIAHTFFPGYDRKVQCRPDPRHRSPDDLLETFCDIGASELLFPLPWFANDAASVTTAAGLLALAERYGASREATLRRFAETSTRPVAAVYLSWKLKPTQERALGPAGQANLFGLDREAEAREAWKLRIDYAVASESFARAGHFLPADKSVDLDGPFAQAAGGCCADAECALDLGGTRGRFRVLALPLYLPPEERGPDGAAGVAAVIEALDAPRPKKSVPPKNPGLFG